MISKKTKYALKALTGLAAANSHSGAPVLTSRLAEGQRIPRKFLEQILLELKRDGFVKSKMGKKGGYFLAKPAEKIKLGSVIRLFEGPLAPLPCLSKSSYERCEECADEAHCGLRLVFREVHENTLNILDNTSLQDMADKSAAQLSAPMYSI